MSLFADIPLRGFGIVFPAWFNALRSAGVTLEQGAGFSSVALLLNSQAGAADVTGLTADSITKTAYKIAAEIRRETASGEQICLANLFLYWRALTSTWELVYDFTGDDPGIVFSVATAGTVGQVRYTSSTLAGTGYVGTFKYNATKFGVYP